MGSIDSLHLKQEIRFFFFFFSKYSLELSLDPSPSGLALYQKIMFSSLLYLVAVGDTNVTDPHIQLRCNFFFFFPHLHSRSIVFIKGKKG